MDAPMGSTSLPTTMRALLLGDWQQARGRPHGGSHAGAAASRAWRGRCRPLPGPRSPGGPAAIARNRHRM